MIKLNKVNDAIELNKNPNLIIMMKEMKKMIL